MRLDRLPRSYTRHLHVYSPLVPIHNSSASILNVSRVLPPYLLYMPVNGVGGSGLDTPFMPVAKSSGLPCLSNTFLWALKQKSLKR